MKLRHSARTDVGRTRDHNEDDYGIGEGAAIEQFGKLFVVCDGMGGHAAGEVASRIGVQTIIDDYYAITDTDRSEALVTAFERANQRIHTEGRGAMGTTGVAALFHKGALLVANVGDSRAYLVSNKQIRQISRDHSLVGDQIEAGLITAEQARSIHYRNVITRALGYQTDVVVDTFYCPLDPHDVVLLCSDGLHGLVQDSELMQIMDEQPLAEAVEHLVDMANERGGTDNITLIAIVVDAVEPQDALAAEPAETDDPSDDLADPDETTEPIPLAQIAEAVAAQEPAAAPPQPVPPIPTAEPERQLTPLALLLAAASLLILIGVIWYFLSLPPTAPPPTPGITATPVG